MKIIVILNGVSRKKQKFYSKVLPAINNHFDVQVWETQKAGDAETLAARAVIEQADVVLAAGGDGTLHQVINGILNGTQEILPIVGVIPLGTGNDFARVCNLTLDAEKIVRLLKAGQPGPTDIGKIVCSNQHGKSIVRYFINACSVGMGPEVVKRLATNNRAWGPDITYISSIVSTFFNHKPQEFHCKASSWEWGGMARVIAIANGTSFGNAMYIAPDALVDDGSFNTFIAGDLSLPRFLMHLWGIKGREKIRDPKIKYNATQQIHLQSPLPCLLEAEGEMVGFLPATISMMTGKIRFLR